METPCSRPIQNIAENDFLGNSLRKINDNFQILQLNVCQLEHVIKGLNRQLDELGIPEDPRCGKKEEWETCPELERVVNPPDPETCLQDSRIPLINSFINLKNLGCSLYTTIEKLSSVVMRNAAGKETTQAGPFEPTGCTHTDGISPDEYIGDSYDKIRSNLLRLRDEYCRLSNITNNLEKRITCPKPPPRRQRLLNRFTMQGEGGYAWNTYNFVNRDKIYATPEYSVGIQANMGGAVEYNKYKYTTTYDGTTYYGLSGAIRVSLAANNNSVILRNGLVYYSGNGPYMSNWIKNNASIMWDMFMPSTHGNGGPTQVVLLTTGNLFFVDLRNFATNPNFVPPIILPNIERFLAINQSHNSDLLVLSKDKKVYHVVTHSTGGSPSPYAYQEITNIGDTDDIEFMSIGDGANSCYVCYSSDLKKVYPINCSNPNRDGHGSNSFGWFTSKNNTASNIFLDNDEYFVDACGNEFDVVFLTNKRVLCYSTIDNEYDRCGITYWQHPLPSGSKAVRMSTSCSYSMAVELSDGYYLLSRRPITQYATGDSAGVACIGFPTYQYFAKFEIWNTLQRNLSATRPDIFGFGDDAKNTVGECSCDDPPPPEPPPDCVPRRWDLLDRFAMQGEGGYENWTYNFVDRDVIYGSQLYKDHSFTSVLGSGSNLTTYYYTTSLGGKTWHALKNAIRICDGNYNQSGIFRDGNAYVNGDKYPHPWILSTYKEWIDLFMPSSYENVTQGHITQGVLTRDGKLRAILLNLTTTNFPAKASWLVSGPPVIQGETDTGAVVELNNIDRFLTINQSHNGDIFVAGKDNRVWHVGFCRGARTADPFRGAYAKQIKNLEANQIKCICIGDPSRSAYVVYRSNPSVLFEIDCSNPGRDLSNWGWFTERNLTPICSGPGQPLNLRGATYNNFLETGEFFVDMCANEFHWVFLTNKNVHCFRGQSSVSGYKKFPIPPSVSAVRMCTSTSYSMAVELSDGYYLAAYTTAAAFESATDLGSSTGYGAPYQYVQRVPSWTMLAQVLSSGRPDVVPFGTTCDQDPTWNCLKTFVEDAQVMTFGKSKDVILQSNTFYALSAYQEGGAFMDGGGVGFTGSAIVTFRHPGYPAVPDVVFRHDSTPTPGFDDAVIYWSTAAGTVSIYSNHPGALIRTEPLPWKERNDIFVSHTFIDGVYRSVIAKQYQDAEQWVCFFPTE
jgi:hypothetical protein